MKNAYFGEQHLHTAYSLDAYIGGARLTPSDAYRFAKGEEVEVGGIKHRISTPLDWAAVTDHAEYIGEMYSTLNAGAPGHDQEHGANLDRIQIIKGWIDADGRPQDGVYDVAWSGDRERGQDGKVPAVGSTVDLTKATYTNGIGSPRLMGSWSDPDFNIKQHAVYYVRVLEIPTPRWNTYDAVRNGLALLEEAPATVQERAWTSPIWYKP